MYQDARIYIEMRYDGDTADVVVALFRDRGILPTEVKTIEFSCDSHELTDNVWHEAYMTFMAACRAITEEKA
jgi:hypothetical protein